MLSVEECNGWFSCYGYLVAASCGTNHSCGTVILFRPIFSLISSSIESAGRFVYCEFLFPDKKFHVVSLYAPNANPQRDEFFAHVSSMVDPSLPTVLCGDFNAVFDRRVDHAGSAPFYPSRDSSVIRPPYLSLGVNLTVPLFPGLILLEFPCLCLYVILCH